MTLDDITYDFKSEELVQEVFLDEYAHLIISINHTFSQLRLDEFISIYATRELMNDLFLKLYTPNYLCQKTSMSFPYLNDNYYLMTISYDGEITLETAYKDNNLTLSEATLTFFDASCPTRMLKKLQFNEENLLIFNFNEEI